MRNTLRNRTGNGSLFYQKSVEAKVLDYSRRSKAASFKENYHLANVTLDEAEPLDLANGGNGKSCG